MIVPRNEVKRTPAASFFVRMPSPMVAASEQPPKAKVCRCGHGRGHVMVSPEGDYSVLGWMMLLIGISATPTAIHYRCRVCRDLIETTRDPKQLRETRLL